MNAGTLFILILAVASFPMQAKKTVEDRLAEFGSVVDARLKPLFDARGVPYPPARVSLIGLKQEGFVQVYAAGPDGDFKHIKTYPVLAASGGLGPKLREGDCQVPEGIYQVPFLNPNSRFHLALRVSYPNKFDRAMAKLDGRTELGGDIMIHGNQVSIGCLAMGDPAAEDLFILAAKTGRQNVSVILTPVDFRVRDLPPEVIGLPAWTKELYKSIRAELKKYPYPAKPK
jgi:hypothetical protein